MKKAVHFTPGIVLLCFVLPLLVSSQGNPAYHLIRRFMIASAGGWDYLAVEPGSNRLFVSHGTQVNVLDKTTGDSIGVIPNTTGVHGIAFVKEINRGYTSNGRLNNVTVFDLSTLAVLGQIPAGENPDAILYEPLIRKIITCNGRSKNLSFIDPFSGKLVDSVSVGGKPETAVSDGSGKLFVNIEDKNEIVVVDLKKLRVLAHWPLSPAEEPTGLAFDRKTNRLFAGCGNKMLAVVNAGNGQLVTTLPIGDGCDGVAFDAATGTIFASNGSGTVSIYREKTANDFELLGNLVTKRGARTLAVDETTHQVYLPSADFQTADPAQPKARPAIIPGTFQVLVIGQ